MKPFLGLVRDEESSDQFSSWLAAFENLERTDEIMPPSDHSPLFTCDHSLSYGEGESPFAEKHTNPAMDPLHIEAVTRQKNAAWSWAGVAPEGRSRGSTAVIITVGMRQPSVVKFQTHTSVGIDPCAPLPKGKKREVLMCVTSTLAHAFALLDQNMLLRKAAQNMDSRSNCIPKR